MSKEQESTNNELMEELWKDNFISEMVAFEELTKYEDKAIERPKFILDLVSLTLHQQKQQLKAELLEKVEYICKSHIDWKPTEGYSSEEENGYQKGLQAEAKLFAKDIKTIINNKLKTYENN